MCSATTRCTRAAATAARTPSARGWGRCWSRAGGTRDTWDTWHGTEQVTAGAGGKDAYGPEADHVLENEELGMRMEHFQEGNGFVYFTVREEEVRLQFVNTYDMVVYQSVRQKMRANWEK